MLTEAQLHREMFDWRAGKSEAKYQTNQSKKKKLETKLSVAVIAFFYLYNSSRSVLCKCWSRSGTIHKVKENWKYAHGSNSALWNEKNKICSLKVHYILQVQQQQLFQPLFYVKTFASFPIP